MARLSSYTFCYHGKRRARTLARAALPATLLLPAAHCLVRSGDSVRSLFNQLPLNKGLLNSVERGRRRGTDLCEDGRGPGVSALETQEARAETPPPGETVTFPPNSSHSHVRIFTWGSVSPSAQWRRRHKVEPHALQSFHLKSSMGLWF